jgi:hypothetical protein
VKLNESNAHELADVAEEVGALAFRGQLQYPGAEAGDWELDTDVITNILFEVRDRDVLSIPAPVDGDELVHLCSICGFVLGEPGVPCPRYVLINEELGAALDNQRAAEEVLVHNS